MKTDHSFTFAAATIIAGVIVTLTTPAHAAGSGRVIQRSGAYQTSRGHSGTFSSTTTRAKGDITHEGTWTNETGGTGTRSSERVIDSASGTATFNGTATHPDGKTSSWSGTAEKNTDGSISEQGSLVTAKGKTETFTATETKAAPGSTEKQEVITTANGKTIDRTVDTAVNQADGTGSRTVTTTLPNGQVETRSATFTETVTTFPLTSQP